MKHSLLCRLAALCLAPAVLAACAPPASIEPTQTPAPPASQELAAEPAATQAPAAEEPAPTAEPGLGPKTGDPGVSALWFAVLPASGLGLAAVCRRRRRGTR